MAIPLILSDVPDATPYIQYIATSGQTTFPYPFPITQDSDLVVVVAGVTQNTDSGYSLTGQGDDTGGNVVFTTGQTVGTIITLYRDIAIERLTQIAQNSGFSSTVFNAEFNNIYLIMQQLEASIAQCLQIPNTNNPAPTTELSPTLYANKYLSFDSNGNPIPAALTSSGTITEALIDSLLTAATPAVLAPLSKPLVTTAAELAAGVTPTDQQWLEGDGRRYGATTLDSVGSTNVTAFTNALLVSAAGGSPAIIPPGQYKINADLPCTEQTQMIGYGWASILSPQACNGLVFTAGQSEASGSVNRSFRDFAIIGSDPTNSTYTAIYSNVAANAGLITDVHFDNIFISNFQNAVICRGFTQSSFFRIFGYNLYNGFVMNGQSVNTTFLHCNLIAGGDETNSTGALASNCGFAFLTTAGESCQSTRLISNYTYAFAIGVDAVVAFELQIEACDFSYCTGQYGIYFTPTQGGSWVRDCWIELAGGSACIGINVPNVTAEVYSALNIEGNFVRCDTPYAGCTGISVGAANNGAIIKGNTLNNWDQGILLGASFNLTCKYNRIDILTSVYSSTSYTISLNSLARNPEIGPNYIVGAGIGDPCNAVTLPNAVQAATGATSTTIGVATAASSYPVGTPVMFDATAQGFTQGVVYWVTASSGTSISVAPTAGGSAISATGTGAIGSVHPAPVPVTFTAAMPKGMAFYGSGMFLATLTGMSATIQGAMEWVAGGGVATVTAGAATITGTSNATSFSFTGLPAFLQPATNQPFIPCVVENSGSNILATAFVSQSGTVTFQASSGSSPTTLSGTGFTSSGTKGLNGTQITYSIS